LKNRKIKIGESFVKGVDCPVKNRVKVKIEKGVFLLKVQIEKGEVKIGGKFC